MKGLEHMRNLEDDAKKKSSEIFHPERPNWILDADPVLG